MHVIEVLIVVYKPELAVLGDVLRALTFVVRDGKVPLTVRLWHNDGDVPQEGGLAELYAQVRTEGLLLDAGGGEGNLGFGNGINRLLRDCTSPYVLLLNQDAIPEPGAIERLWQQAIADANDVAAWEMRQIPYEHPKLYDPVSQTTEWVSGAAVLARTGALRQVGGFDSRIFMYGEDVDLSWRLRCAGYRLLYVPRAAVVHRTYGAADEVKPLQALEGIYVNLCLRARFSGHRQIFQGLSMAFAEWLLPQSFPGRRRGIAKAVWKFLRNYRYFIATRCGARGFEPRFAGWGYEIRRDGAFHVFKAANERVGALPLVSVLIRTHRRGGFLREALKTVANQTYPNIEAVVVEDGSDQGEAVCMEFSDKLRLQYHRIVPGAGRSVAGNLALAKAQGEWFCFLDDDDQFFADHIEVLVETVLGTGLKGAYALSWRTSTRIVDPAMPEYEEVSYDRIPDEPFSRVAMWHHNFLPIQAVLFHRSLYAAYGGFAEDMEQLEDWNLWTRYTIRDDFVQVRKLTSKYRVPAELSNSADRQKKLDNAYRDAVARQATMKFEASPEFVRRLAEEYVQSNAIVHIGRDQLRAHVARRPWLARVAAMRSVLRRRLQGS